MRRIACLGLFLVVCFSLLSACSSSNDEPNKVEREIFDKRKMPKAAPPEPK